MQSARDGSLFFVADSEMPSIEIVTQWPTCESVEVGQLGLITAGANFERTETIPHDQAVMRLDDAIGPLTHETIRKCIARFSATSETIGQLALLLPLVGLRDITVLGADDVAFVSTNDECGTLSPLLNESIPSVGNLRGQLHFCRNTSLQSCEYPDEISVGLD